MERHCKNCDQVLYANHVFCSKCGSKWVDYRLNPKSVSTEFSQKFLGSDNVFLVTMLALIIRPEDVIDGYVTGRRKRYINPINLYLISLTLVGLQLFIIRQFNPALLGYDEIIDQDASREFLNYLYDYFGFWTTVLMPAYIITGYLVFLDLKKYNFSEQVVFYVYAFGFTNIITALLTPLMLWQDISYMVIAIPVTLMSLLQISWYYKRIFKLSLGKIILRAMIAIPIYLIINLIYIILLIVIIVLIFMFFYPDLLQNIEIN